jgi:hypothetical protein
MMKKIICFALLIFITGKQNLYTGGLATFGKTIDVTFFLAEGVIKNTDVFGVGNWDEVISNNTVETLMGKNSEYRKAYATFKTEVEQKFEEKSDNYYKQLKNNIKDNNSKNFFKYNIMIDFLKEKIEKHKCNALDSDYLINTLIYAGNIECNFCKKYNDAIKKIFIDFGNDPRVFPNGGFATIVHWLWDPVETHNRITGKGYNPLGYVKENLGFAPVGINENDNGCYFTISEEGVNCLIDAIPKKDQESFLMSLFSTMYPDEELVNKVITDAPQDYDEEEEGGWKERNWLERWQAYEGKVRVGKLIEIMKKNQQN